MAGMSFDADLGPINYVVVAFDSDPIGTAGLAEVSALVDSGRILLLDVEFVSKSADGSLSKVSAESVGAPDFQGASTDLIDDDDVALAGERIAAGGVALVLVYEDLTLLKAIKAWQEEGAEIVSEGPVVVDDFVDALDHSEQN